MKIAVFGSKGKFGETAAKLFSSNGHEVSGFDISDGEFKIPGGFDIYFLAIPLASVIKMIKNLKDGVIIEIGSIKKPLKGFSGKLVSIHPMFGPKSINDPAFRNIIYIDDLSLKDGDKIIQALFPGFRMIHMTTDQHDSAMGDLLVKPYIFSLLANGVMTGEYDFGGFSYNSMKKFKDLVNSESRQVVMDTILLNPESPEIIRKIREYLDNLENQMREAIIKQ